MTTTFDYTDDFSPNSSFINEVTYNENTKELVVELDTSDDFYVYTNVQPATYRAFKDSSSAGQFYGLYIKGKFESRVTKYPDFEFGDCIGVVPEVETPGAPVYNINNNFSTLYDFKTGLPIDPQPAQPAFVGISAATAVVTFLLGGRKFSVDIDADTVADVYTELAKVSDALGKVITVKEITFKYV